MTIEEYTQKKGLKIKEEFPPNYELLKEALNPPEQAIFCYGNTIYNPSNRELHLDVIEHESIHSQRQGNTPDAWYAQYLTNEEFRKEEELIAYRHQLKFAETQGITSEIREWLIGNMAEALSRDYKLDLTTSQAKTLLRK